MCIAANEPGGPRRCDTANKIDRVFNGYHSALQDFRERRDELARYDEWRGNPDAPQIPEWQIEQSRKGKKLALAAVTEQRAQLITLLDAHAKNEMGNKALGTLAMAAEDIDSGAILDDSKPYVTFSYNDFHNNNDRRIARSIWEEAGSIAVRHRYIPVLNEHGEETGMSNLVVDVQVYLGEDVDTQASKLNAELIDKTPPELDLNNKSTWYVSIEDYAGAVYRGIEEEGLVTAREASEKGCMPTAVRAWRDLVAPKSQNPSHHHDEPRDPNDRTRIDVKALRHYLANYPGTDSYAQKVRQIVRSSPPGHLPASEMNVLTPAIARFREYDSSFYAKHNRHRSLVDVELNGAPSDFTAASLYREFDRQAEERYGQKAGSDYKDLYDLRYPRGKRVQEGDIVSLYVYEHTDIPSRYPGGTVIVARDTPERVSGKSVGYTYYIDVNFSTDHCPLGAHIGLKTGISEGPYVSSRGERGISLRNVFLHRSFFL